MNEESIRFVYRPLSFLGKTHGTILFLAGVFLIYTFFGEVTHRFANLGFTQPGLKGQLSMFFCNSQICQPWGWLGSSLLWLVFLLAGILITCVGAALFLTKRVTVLDQTGTLTVQDFSGLMVRRYSSKDIRAVSISKQPVFAVFGVGMGVGVHTSQMGERYVLLLDVVGKKTAKILALFADEKTAEESLGEILKRFQPKG